MATTRSRDWSAPIAIAFGVATLSIGVGLAVLARSVGAGGLRPLDVAALILAAASLSSALFLIVRFVDIRRHVDNLQPESLSASSGTWESLSPEAARLREDAFDTLLALEYALSRNRDLTSSTEDAIARLRDVSDEDSDIQELQALASAAVADERRSDHQVVTYVLRLRVMRTALLEMGYLAEAGDLGAALREHLHDTPFQTLLVPPPDDDEGEPRAGADGGPDSTWPPATRSE